MTTDRIRQLLAAGEGLKIEYKECVKRAKTVIGFRTVENDYSR